MFYLALLPTLLLFAGATFAADSNEDQFIQILQSSASLTEKDAACARLKFIGTDRCIPVLSALLTDEHLSHSARYALEPMSLPAAGRALTDALGKTAGLTKVGIIGSLGFRHESGATPALARLLSDADAAVATAAAATLGQIADSAALAALQSGVAASSGPTRDAIVDSLLRCANHLLSAGQPAQARAVFQRLHQSASSDGIRMAAFRGILHSSGKEALGLVSQAITGKPGPEQTAAVQLIHDLQVPGATSTFAQLLARVPPPLQTAIIDGLSQRADPSAVPAIKPLVSSPNPQVRLAALEAVGELGDESTVTLLAESAATANGAEQATAREALVQLRHGRPDDALLQLLSSAKPPVQAEAARALGARSAQGAVPKLIVTAQQTSDPVRRAAVLALAQLVDQPQLASLVQLLLAANDPAGRQQAAEAVNSACLHIQSDRGHLDVTPLTSAVASGSTEARIALLPVCAGFNDPKTRDALRAAAAGSQPQVRVAAIRAICDSTDPELLPDLVKLASTLPEPNLRTLAIGGCVRLTTQEESVKLPNVKRVETFKDILAAAPNPEQKRLVLSGLAEVPDAGAISLAEPMLAEAGVSTEAARAIIKLSSRVPDQEVAVAALQKAIAAVPDAATRVAARDALEQLRPSGGFIPAWQITGPYREAGQNYAALFDVSFPPESGADVQAVKWTPIGSAPDPRGPGVVNLLKAFGGQECVAYARVAVHSDKSQNLRLELGSDDGVKAWLNQKLVHAHNVARALKAGSDKANVQLNAGWNQLVLKITQHNQGWAFCARFLNSDGTPSDGLQFDAAGHVADSGQLSQPSQPARAAVIPRDFDPNFKKLLVTDKFWAEGADYADFNRDGHMDIVSGPFWYEGPYFTNRHEIWPATNSFNRSRSDDASEESVPGFEGALGVKNAYSECFLTFTYDFNNDGWPDVLVIGFPGKSGYWYENPKGAPGPWPRHEIFDEVGNESPMLADVTGDGKPELLCCARACLGYLEADWKNPAALWTFHPVTPKGSYQKFTHGVGCGDINGDGRVDILEKDGWWEQPASRAGDPVWIKHPFHFADAAAQMLVYDVNGDGLNDVITSLNAHGYGLAWYEQVRTNGEITFRQHLILNPNATPDRYGISFTQLHSLALADMDGDGLKDIVTGKRFWAHGKNGPDPESDGFPALLYWFQLTRPAPGRVEFIPHLIDNDSGVGTQVTVGSIMGHAHPDIVVGNKKGVFLFEDIR